MTPAEVPADLLAVAKAAVLPELPSCASCASTAPEACTYCQDDAELFARHALAAVLPLYGAIVADEILDLGDADYEAAKADPATGVRSYREGFLDGHDRAGRVVEKYRTARLTTTTEEPTT